MEKKKLLERGIKVGVFVLAAVAVTGIIFYIQKKPAAYHTAKAAQGDIKEILTASGDIKTEESKTYYAVVSAPISKMDLKEGDEIKPGELLAEYDMEDLELLQKQSALRVAQADSAYQSTVKQNEKNTLIYQGAAMTEASFCEMISKQWEVISDLREKLAKTEVKQSDINWLTSRMGAELDEDDRDDFAKTLDARRAEYQNMKVPELTAELAKQQAIYSDMQAFRSQYASQKESADVRLIDDSAQQELLLKKKEASLQSADDADSLEDAKAGVQAEFHGIVTSRLVEEGATVTKGTPLFTADNLDLLYVSADVSKYDISKLKKGLPAEIVVGDRKYPGKITKIDRIASTDHSDKAKIPVHVGFIGTTDDVCLGIEGDVNILIQEEKNVLTIPKRAVYEDDNGSYVYVLFNGKVSRKTVETGIADEENYEVKKGITKDDELILDAITDSALGKAGKGIEE